MLLKIWQILHLTLCPHFFRESRKLYPYPHLNVIALSIAIPLFHMFCLAFAESNNLFILRANFEHHIIKFGRLQFVEQKCQPLNINVNVEYKNVNC